MGGASEVGSGNRGAQGQSRAAGTTFGSGWGHPRHRAGGADRASSGAYFHPHDPGPPGSAVWGGIPGSRSVSVGPIDGPPELVSHRDYCPGDVVFRGGVPAALIDFDLARPTTPVVRPGQRRLLVGAFVGSRGSARGLFRVGRRAPVDGLCPGLWDGRAVAYGSGAVGPPDGAAFSCHGAGRGRA